jgi:hypothetical protein
MEEIPAPTPSLANRVTTKYVNAGTKTANQAKDGGNAKE